MIKPIVIPRGVANIMKLGNCVEINVVQNWYYRPDKLIKEATPNPSMRLEIMNNYISNTSPISLKKNSKYTLADNMFKEYFCNG